MGKKIHNGIIADAQCEIDGQRNNFSDPIDLADDDRPRPRRAANRARQ
jgi:hypothetical protein